MARRIVGDRTEEVPGSLLVKGDLVRVEAGEVIPGDGEVVEGVASVDESAITGESAPVIREAGGDRSAVTGGTRVLSDWLEVRITSNPGETFLDRMIALVEGAKRQKTPNEIALNILLAGLTLVFLLAVATLLPYAIYSARAAGAAGGFAPALPPSIPVLVALLVCLIPTTIGGLLSAIGIAGMDRLIQQQRPRDVRPRGRGGGRRRHPAARQDRHDHARQPPGGRVPPVPGVAETELADAAQLASLADETPEGRSIVVLAKDRHGLRGREFGEQAAQFVPFTAQTRMSGVDLAGGRVVRKGAPDAVLAFVASRGGTPPAELRGLVERVATAGGTPLVVADGGRALGVIHLKDIVKGGMRERFAQLRRMGIRTVMITGDNPLTARAIAAEAGVDDFLAEATPEDKMDLIRREQAAGKLVAMTGDGTNDAPALAQADVGVAMNTGTAGGQGGRQHGRPRLRPHQADRDRGDRQAAADDARRAHHLLDRQRRRQVLRHHPGAVRGPLRHGRRGAGERPARRPRPDGPRHPAVGDPRGGDLQRPGDRRAHPARPARPALPPARERPRCCAATS